MCSWLSTSKLSCSSDVVWLCSWRPGDWQVRRLRWIPAGAATWCSCHSDNITMGIYRRSGAHVWHYKHTLSTQISATCTFTQGVCLPTRVTNFHNCVGSNSGVSTKCAIFILLWKYINIFLSQIKYPLQQHHIKTCLSSGGFIVPVWIRTMVHKIYAMRSVFLHEQNLNLKTWQIILCPQKRNV